MTDRREEIIKEICELLGVKLGREFAECYEEFYSDKKLSTIVASAQELLIEGFGKDEAERLMMSIVKKLEG